MNKRIIIVGLSLFSISISICLLFALVQPVNGEIKEEEDEAKAYGRILSSLEKKGEFAKLRDELKSNRDNIFAKIYIHSKANEFIKRKKKNKTVTTLDWIYAHELLMGKLSDDLKFKVWTRLIKYTATEIDLEYTDVMYSRIEKSLKSDKSKEELKLHQVSQIIHMKYITEAEAIIDKKKDMLEKLEPYYLFTYGDGLIKKKKHAKGMKVLSLLIKKHPKSIYTKMAQKTIKRSIALPE